MLTETTGPVLYAPINENSAAANVIVAAVPGHKIRVLGLVLSNNDASNPVVATIQDGAGSPQKIMGPLRLAAGQPLPVPASGLGYGETGVGQSLDLLLSGAIVVGGSVTYQLVK